MKKQASFKFQQNFRAYFILLILLLLFGNIYQRSFAQNDASDLFGKNCAVCHTLSEEKLIGPGLLGITERHDEEWLISFIKNSTQMIKEGDPKAVALFNEYNKIQMPSMPKLSNEEIIGIINYIKDYDPEAEKESLVANITDTNYSEGAIKRGERLFMGYIPFENNNSVCANCHNTKTLDTLNWYPSAYELSQVYEELGPAYIASTLKKPTSRTMKVVHKNSTFTDEEIYFVNAYLSEMAHTGLEQAKYFPVKLMIFLGLGLLMTLALIDLFITKKIRFKLIHTLILVIGILFQLKIVAHEAIDLSRTKDYMPDQPIKFSHKVHAGQNKIDCKYCHYSSDYSKSAGIPALNVCLNCHNVVREASNSGKFEINKIHRYIEKNEPVEWIRIYNLPEHVFFSHAQHVKVGKVECQTCHGDIESMDMVKQISDLSMGWCVNCHRETKVQFMTNEYYSKYMKLHDELKSGMIDSVTVEDIGGLDCMKCHY
ncbi:cytochrome c3 family protein [candidate division KSB1 bacterium]